MKDNPILDSLTKNVTQEQADYIEKELDEIQRLLMVHADRGSFDKYGHACYGEAFARIHSLRSSLSICWGPEDE